MQHPVRIEALTTPPRHHFFGYYGVNAWDRARRRHLALETDFHDRRPGPEDKATVGLVDRTTGRFRPYAETAAFNLQQGSMMFWIDAGPGEEFAFNDWQGPRLISRAVDPSSGRARALGAAIEAVSPAEPLAVGLNFARMAHLRPVVGYANAAPPDAIDPCPDDDGLLLIDLRSGEARLLLSIAEVVAAGRWELPADQPVWLNHVYYNPSGTRLFFLCRAKLEGRNFLSSLWTVNPDGTHLACQIELGTWISHMCWLDDRRIMVSTDVLGGRGGFVTFTDGEGDFAPIGRGVLPRDGHNALSPAGRWIACDCYPRGPEPQAELMLYDLQTNRKVTLGRFASPEPFRYDIRCDLHPRWSGDGRLVTFDSIHEGTRQIYVADVSAIVGS